MPPVRRLLSASLPALACALALAGPAAAQAAAADARNPDPYEHWNRKVYAFNQTLYAHVFHPAAVGWKRVVPSVIREGLRNALSNLGEPVVFVNDVFQGRADDASTTLKRFLVNSTAGMAGLADVAAAHGAPHHDNGFGTTLGRYGVGPGPYIYLPVLGPGDGRDLFGGGVDTLTNPQTWIGYGAREIVGPTEGAVGGVNTFADADDQLQTIQATATDPYATLRSLYLQNRAAQIRGEAVDVNALPDFDDPGGATAPAAPGSRSPRRGGAALKTPGPNAPAGDTSALPQAGPPTGGPDGAAPSPAPTPSAPGSPG